MNSIIKLQYYFMASFTLAGLLFFLLMTSSVWAQTGSLPMAVTIPVLGASSQEGGQVVVFNEASQSYSVSRDYAAPNIIGVTVQSPPLVFSTASNTTPVVTSGSAYVLVDSSGSSIKRGDLLVSSARAGVATKATTDDDNVFAIALEDSRGVGSGTTVLAQIDSVGAKALLEERRAIEEEREEGEGLFGQGGDTDSETVDKEEEKGFIRQFIEEYSRATLASIIAIGSLFFIMYTFRTTIINATLAVGRNPRARNAIMTVSIENIIFALIICLVAIFVAIAVLVLPVA